MALALFPTPPGVTYPIGKVPLTSTRHLEAASGLDYSAQNWTYPKWKFTLPIEFLRQFSSYKEWSNIVGFILSQAGMFGIWLFNDTTDDTVLGQQLGVGNGVQKAFPLVRALGSFVEPIYYCNSLNGVFINGVQQTSGFSLTQSGAFGPDTVTFTSAPAASAVVTANFSFYFVCRFLQDDPEFANFTGGRWSVKQLSFQTVKAPT